MIATQSAIRGRLEQTRLSFEGYSRQLARLDLSPERRERIETDVRLLEQEIATLETLAQLGRVEPDRERVEAAVRERLAAVQDRMASDLTLSNLTGAERNRILGEVRALSWALGEDRLTQGMQMIMEGHEYADPSRTDRALPAILINMLRAGPDTDSRASAAYELGKLRIAQAIPTLADALGDDPFVAEAALHALCAFQDDQLAEAGLDESLIEKVRSVRQGESS